MGYASHPCTDVFFVINGLKLNTSLYLKTKGLPKTRAHTHTSQESLAWLASLSRSLKHRKRPSHFSRLVLTLDPSSWDAAAFLP